MATAVAHVLYAEASTSPLGATMEKNPTFLSPQLSAMRTLR